jgi:hypothetical protein
VEDSSSGTLDFAARLQGVQNAVPQPRTYYSAALFLLQEWTLMTHNENTTADSMNMTDHENLVEVMFARSTAEANECVRALIESDIPARMEGSGRPGAGYGIAVLVPPDRMILASELLAAKAHDDEDEEDEESEDTADEEVDDIDDDEFDDDDDDLDDDEDEDDDDDEDEDDEFEVGYDD